MKWKTSEERKAACERVCEHIASGLSRSCFVEANWQTVEWYIQKFPEDFESEKINEAVRANKLFWESVGLQGAIGKIEGFNATSWIFNMKNRFPEDWKDKKDLEHGGTLVQKSVTLTPEDYEAERKALEEEL